MKPVASFGLPLLIFLTAAVVLFDRSTRVGYNADEGQFIATAEYFDLVFLRAQLTGAPWDETYWTLTQPPITRYILGAAIRASGNTPPPLNTEHRIEEVRGPDRERFLDPRTFTDERRLAQERRIDRPSAAVLQAGRLPMALFGAGAVTMLYLASATLGGPIAGLAAALGLLTAPLAGTLLPRAHAESPLIFFTLAALACALRQPNSSVAWTIGAGVTAGLAAATKLPAVLAVAALGLRGPVEAWISRLTGAPLSRRETLRPITSCAIAMALFVALNPFMWPDPIGRTLAMLRFRQQEVIGQRALNVDDAVPESLSTRAALLLERTFVTEMPIGKRTAIPLEAGLAALGLTLTLRRATKHRDASATTLLVWLAMFFAGTAPNLGLDWQRYYLPTVALGLVLVGLGAAWLADRAWNILRPASRIPSSSPTIPHASVSASSGSAG